MTEKKEIKLKKSLLTLIIKSIMLSILTLYILQHFGKISTDIFASSPKIYFFDPPFNGHNINTTEKLFEYPNYFEKVKYFYLPSIFENKIHLIITILAYVGILAFFGNYKVKLS